MEKCCHRENTSKECHSAISELDGHSLPIEQVGCARGRHFSISAF